MEFMEGTELHKLEGKKVKGADVKKALTNGFYSILEQVFVYGLFHADPHPSNIFVMKDNKVGWVDFGIIGLFDDNLKDKASDIFMGITEGDTDKVIEVLMELGEITDEIDLGRFRSKLNDVIYSFGRSSVKNIKISKALEEVLGVALEFGLRIPREFVLFGKAIVTIEGTALIYYPDFKFHERVQPFLEEIMERRYEPKKMIRKGFMNFLGIKKAVEKLPTQATRVLDKLERGKIKIEMRDTDIDKLSVELDKSSNRLTYGMIIAALLVSGSLTVNIGDKVFYNLPIISALCFSGAAFLGLMLFISIISEKR